MDIASTLRYNKWKFVGLAIVVVVGLNVIALSREPDVPQYKAKALVIASELAIRVDALPRTAVAIFNGGTVARLAASYAGTGISPEDLIPGIVDITPVENTSVVDVDAIHPDPKLAALYANSAGRALAEELNRIGPGLGSFALQIEATESGAVLLEVSRLPNLVFSVVAALLLVAGLAALVAFVQGSGHAVPLFRGPVRRLDADDLHESDSAEGTGTDQDSIIGTVKLGKSAPSRAIQPRADSNDQKAVASSPTSIPTFERSLAAPPAPREEPPVSPFVSTGDHLKPIEPLIPHLESLRQPSPMHPLLFVDEQAAHVLESIDGVDAVFAARLVAAGITSIEELSGADGKWLSDAIEVRRDIVVDWISQANQHIRATFSGDSDEGPASGDGASEVMESSGPSPSTPEEPIRKTEHSSPDSGSVRLFGEAPGAVEEPSRPSAARGAPPMAPVAPMNGSKKAPPAAQRADDGEEGLTLRSIRGIGAVFAERLVAVGITTVEELATANASGLAYTMEVRYGTVADWIKQAGALSSSHDPEP